MIQAQYISVDCTFVEGLRRGWEKVFNFYRTESLIKIDILANGGNRGDPLKPVSAP